MNSAIALRADTINNKTIDAVIGVTFFILIYRISFVNAITMGVLPFFTIELVKIFTAAAIYSKISHRSKIIFP